jgi:ornithine--oxo-acid transaminase
MKAIEILQDDGLAKRSADLGRHLLDRLRDVSSSLVREVRGSGLWVGVECAPALVSAREVCERLLAKGVLSKETHETVVRFAPPLTISRRDLDWAVDQFEQVLDDIGRGVPLETLGT